MDGIEDKIGSTGKLGARGPYQVIIAGGNLAEWEWNMAGDLRGIALLRGVAWWDRSGQRVFF